MIIFWNSTPCLLEIIQFNGTKFFFKPNFYLLFIKKRSSCSIDVKIGSCVVECK
nr:MAG TPA: hypothetical protein [Caudoviricetes sp.]DAK35729.1 MAG TPA: hypothetical protein [Caudoviricetes sp.]DAM25404.1 MAG TPA: hypothetical protein [Caudoviricetes sp.]